MIGIILTLLFLFLVGQTVVVLIREYCRPHKAVSWIVVLYLFPVIGFLFYWFVSPEYSCLRPIRSKDDKALETLKKQLIHRCEQRLEAAFSCNPSAFPEEDLLNHLKFRHALPFTAWNETTVYREGRSAFAAMLEAISAAKHHIHLEFYIIRADVLGSTFRDLLIRKAQEGVQVRVLFDGIGCHRLRKSFLKPLREAGAEIGCFGPPLRAFLSRRINYRNHRKIVVVDGTTGFLGGLNIGDEYVGKNAELGYWRDTHFRLRGDAALWIQYAFAEDWLEVKRQFLNDPSYYPKPQTDKIQFLQIVKSGPDETIVELIFTLIVTARKRIYIETPYFVPDPGVLMALKTAAGRGIDIRVIIPSVPDTQLVYWATLSFVEEMLSAGIRFYRYRKGFIHAKVLLCDDTACSGSANMDMRSFTGQFELNAVFVDDHAVRHLEADFFRDLEESDEITLEDFLKRPRSQRMKEVFARLLASLF